MLGKTAGEVVAEVRLLRAQDKDISFLIVEGGDDQRFWTSRVTEKCRVVVSSCKTVGKSAVYRLNAGGFVGHVGVLDADYDDFQVHSNIPGNLIFWDAHSIEVILFLSAAFVRVAHELIGAGKLVVLEAALGVTLREHVAAVALQIGKFRALHAFSGEDGEKGAFAPFKFMSRGNGLVLDSTALIEEAVRMKAVPSMVQAARKLAQLPDIDRRYYIRGHDITAIISIAVGDSGASASASDVEEALRLAFDIVDFQATTVYSELRQWETLRPPFRVLH